jgi:hypothetical protein
MNHMFHKTEEAIPDGSRGPGNDPASSFKKMKTLRFLFLIPLLGFPLLHAQIGTFAPQSSPQPHLPPPPKEGPMALLSPAERAELKAAHDKAITLDPTLDARMKAAHQAMEEAKKAMHDAMIAADPAVAPILEKIAPPKKISPPKWNQGALPSVSLTKTSGTTSGDSTSMEMLPAAHDGRGFPPGFANLSPAEQQQIRADHDQVKNDPAVIAAKQALKSAVTPETRLAAKESLHQAIDGAILKADPSAAPILAKLHPPAPPQSAPPPVQ